MTIRHAAHSSWLVASIIGSVSLAACGPKWPPPDQAAIVNSAPNDYQFGSSVDPVPATGPLPDPGESEATAPKMTFAQATPKGTPTASGVVLAKVNSTKEYKRLGIASGDNYIWQDRSDSDPKKWEAWMVPVDLTVKPKKLKRTGDEYSHGPPSGARMVKALTRGVVSFAACLDDPGCTSGHCGYGGVD